ncbi:MAG TPA: hypothetical protein PKA00_23625 [Saprospiraceae bacterium]|nr:hypothetical protein [Saprospiraceae bacterium]HMQ85920.1 hypothetical protein [Saprospiraceae bacterium]
MKNWPNFCLPLLLLPLFLPLLAKAQWSSAIALPGTGNVNCQSLAVFPDGRLLMGGTFDEYLVLDDQTLTAIGKADAFLSVFSANGEVLWTWSGGATENDEVTHVAIAANGDFLAFGSFWFELPIADTLLLAAPGTKALFLARFAGDGNLLWAQSMTGIGLKGSAGLALDANNQIWIGGHFEQNLAIGEQTLDSGQSDGSTHLFLALLADTGTPIWTRQAGGTDDTRMTALTLSSQGDAILGGFFNGVTQIGAETFTANTSDRDAFLARYDQDGQVLWAKKAGGVFDDDLTALWSDGNGHFYAGGQLVGVMTLSEQLSIQSSNGNGDFFLLKYLEDGTPQAARALGGTQAEQVSCIAMVQETIVLGGLFSGAMAFDGFSVDAGLALNGFVAGFNSDLTVKWLALGQSSSLALIRSLAVSTDHCVYAAGSYIDDLNLGAIALNGSSASDGFLAQIWKGLTPTAAPIKASSKWQFWPNPATDRVFIQGLEKTEPYFLMNAYGTVVKNGLVADHLYLGDLPGGIYFLVIENKVERILLGR